VVLGCLDRDGFPDSIMLLEICRGYISRCNSCLRNMMSEENE